MKNKENTKEKLISRGFAGVFYLASRTLDSLLTAHNANKYGTSIEENPVTKYFMDYMGVDRGVIANSLGEISIVLPTVYKNKKVLEVSSKQILYIFGTAHLIGAATNIPYIIKDYL